MPRPSWPEVAAAAKRSALAGASGNSGDHPVPDRGRVRRCAGSRAATVDADVLARALRAASDAAYRPGAPADRRHHADRDPRDGRDCRWPRGLSLDDAIDAVSPPRPRRVVRTQSMLACCATRTWSTPAPRGCWSMPAARWPGTGARLRRCSRTRWRAPVSLESVHLEESRVPLLHLVSDRGRRDRRGRPRERQLAGFGDCVLVVGEAPLVKVHVHTDEPGQVLSLGGQPPDRWTASRSRTCTSRRGPASGG